MKSILTLSGLLLVFSIASAQTPDVAVGKATYDFTHIRDTAKRDKPYKETLVLLIGRNASEYKSLDKELQREQMYKEVEQQVKNASTPNAVDLHLTGSGVTTDEEIFQYPRDKKLYTEVQLVNYYLVDEPLPQINWHITADTMSIGTLHCQKATTHFKGRDYEAWFCPDLPFQTGPWKLNGLPGLIVQASDSKKEVIFKFAGFEDMSAKNVSIGPPTDDIKATTTEIDRLKAARKADPSGFAKAAHGTGQAKRGGSSGLEGIDASHIKSINIMAAPGGNTRVINNPIELPEGK